MHKIASCEFTITESTMLKKVHVLGGLLDTTQYVHHYLVFLLIPGIREISAKHLTGFLVNWA